MEMNSSSLSVSGASGSSDSLNGLKFGKKIYFEDVGIGVSGKSGTGSSSARPKKGKGVFNGGQPPRCQVEGCKVDLSDVKAYYSRHKVCGMHSKSPKVIVAGIEQRFCQQCSRFHQLPEFDQGKRSCRRRLAGHNERRRKPPSGSLLYSRFGQLSSSLQEHTSHIGSFLMAYPRLPRSDVSDPGNQHLATGKFISNHWLGSSDAPPAYFLSPPSQPYMQDSIGGTQKSHILPSAGIPPGDCFAGASNSSCALSLLSTEPWGPRNRASGPPVNNNLMNNKGFSIIESTLPHCAPMNNFTSNSWGFKGNGGSSSNSPDMTHDFVTSQVSEPHNSQYSMETELSQQGNRQFMEHGSSTHQMHWST